MVRTKQTARKASTPSMSTHQDDSTSSSSGEEEVDMDAEESRQKGDNAWSHKSRAAVDYTLISVEPHRPTKGV